MLKRILYFTFIQVEATIVEEEHEDLSCEALQDDEDAASLQHSLAAVSRKDVSTLVISFLSHIQFIFSSLLHPIFSFALELGHIKMV